MEIALTEVDSCTCTRCLDEALMLSMMSIAYTSTMALHPISEPANMVGKELQAQYIDFLGANSGKQ